MRRKLLATASVSAGVAATSVWLACASVPTFSEGPSDGATASPDGGSTFQDGSSNSDGGGTDPDGRAPDKRFRMFVTSGGGRGDFANGAIAKNKADIFCNDVAGKVSIGGTWVALFWPSATAPSPQQSLKAVIGGWHQLLQRGAAGPVVLTDLNGNGRTDVPITDEYGNEFSGTVWTGGGLLISQSGFNCDVWSNLTAGTGGTYGTLPGTGQASWLITEKNGDCNMVRSFYCLEQPP